MVQKIKRSLSVMLASAFMFASTFMMSGGMAHASAGLDCPNWGHTACVDTTSAYGPVLLVFNSSGTLVWSSGVPNTSVCTVGTAQTRNYDTATHVIYGAGTAVVANIEVAGGMPSCGSTVQAAINLNQEQMDYFRWYSNSNGVTQLLIRN
jgi:hypothetical protein